MRQTRQPNCLHRTRSVQMPASSSKGNHPSKRRNNQIQIQIRSSMARSKSPPSIFARLWRRRGGAGAASLTALCVLLVVYATWRRAFRAPSQQHMFYTFDLVNEFPHDSDAFTQGLVYGGNDTLFESTGLYRKSSIREVHLQSGKVKTHHQMDGDLFGEGLTLLGERLFQVMWLTNTGFTYDRYNFTKREKFMHKMKDGWGLATDGKILFGSDGTSSLYHINPSNFQVLKRVTVKYQEREIMFLNELEYINDEIWANIWQTDCIARISHNDGRVISWILLHKLREDLLKSGYRDIDVLNGIAWDKEKNRLFVTGKMWPKLYEIKLRPFKGALNAGIQNLCPIRSYM